MFCVPRQPDYLIRTGKVPDNLYRLDKGRADETKPIRILQFGFFKTIKKTARFTQDRLVKFFYKMVMEKTRLFMRMKGSGSICCTITTAVCCIAAMDKRLQKVI